MPSLKVAIRAAIHLIYRNATFVSRTRASQWFLDSMYAKPAAKFVDASQARGKARSAGKRCNFIFSPGDDTGRRLVSVPALTAAGFRV
jgi:hypothetical protein